MASKSRPAAWTASTELKAHAAERQNDLKSLGLTEESLGDIRRELTWACKDAYSVDVDKMPDGKTPCVVVLMYKENGDFYKDVDGRLGAMPHRYEVTTGLSLDIVRFLAKYGVSPQQFRDIEEKLFKLPDVNAVMYGIINTKAALRTAVPVRTDGGQEQIEMKDAKLGINIGLVRENASTRKEISNMLKPLGVPFGIEVLGEIRPL